MSKTDTLAKHCGSLAHSALVVVILAFIQPCFAQNSTNAVDVASLLAFKNVVENPPVLSSWTPGSDPCGAPNCSSTNEAQNTVSCNWIGIACRDWRVVQLRLPCTTGSGCLSGTLAPQVANVTQLEEIDLSNNRFYGPVPGSWGSLRNLTFLDLSRNQLTGSLPDTYSTMASLRQLRLGDNSFAGSLPPSWGQLPRLQVLDLSDNKLGGVLPPQWRGMRDINTLSVEANLLEGPIPYVWVEMTALRVLSVRFNCAICGQLPPFEQAYTQEGLLVLARGSSLGWRCSSSNCGSFPLGFVGQAGIVVAVVILMISMCCLRRCYLFRRQSRQQGNDSWGETVTNVLSLRRAPRGQRREEEEEPEGPPPKVDPPIVVLMPDGTTLCTAKPDPLAGAPAFDDWAAQQGVKTEGEDGSTAQRAQQGSGRFASVMMSLRRGRGAVRVEDGAAQPAGSEGREGGGRGGALSVPPENDVEMALQGRSSESAGQRGRNSQQQQVQAAGSTGGRGEGGDLGGGSTTASLHRSSAEGSTHRGAGDAAPSQEAWRYESTPAGHSRRRYLVPVFNLDLGELEGGAGVSAAASSRSAIGRG